MKSLPPSPITFEEFLEWCDEDTRAEWVNGKVVLMSPDSLRHQEIMMFLSSTLDIYVSRRGLGTVILPFLMRLRSSRSGRVPDLLFVSPERASRIRPTYMDGVADLAVEIVSPESITRDRIEKLREYAAAGVREYWVIDPMRQKAEFHELIPYARYREIPVSDDGIFRSRVVDGFFLRLEWLWQAPPPQTLDVVRELGLL